MRMRKRYIPGVGLVEERVPGASLHRRPERFGRRGEIGEFYFDADRNRLEVRTRDGRGAGIELPTED